MLPPDRGKAAEATPHNLFHVTIAALVGPGSLTGISSVPTRAEFEVGYERRLGHAETFFVLEVRDRCER